MNRSLRKSDSIGIRDKSGGLIIVRRHPLTGIRRRVIDER